MKYKKTLTLEGSPPAYEVASSGRRRSGPAPVAPEGGRREAESAKLQPLDARLTSELSLAGLSGIFIPIRNDFTLDVGPKDADQLKQQHERPTESPGQFRDEAHWPSETRAQVKRFRFVICVLALFGLALGLMSRLVLNVSIVEMVRRPETEPASELTTAAGEVASTRPDSLDDSFLTEDPLLFAASHDLEQTTPGAVLPTEPPPATAISPTDGRPAEPEHNDGAEDDGLHFNWSTQDVNLILGSFYVGYMPGILLSGDLTQRYGAKYPLFLCVFGTALINGLTPWLARTSLNTLIGSRILLGLIQGSLLPALYELFNRWLTQTESSIFAPMIKVSMPLGSLIGTLMPGLLAAYRLEWPYLFYICSLMCLLWSGAWLVLATSMPQTSRFVERAELDLIMRKKGSVVLATAPPGLQQPRPAVSVAPARRRPTPWLAIVTNPSVLALTLVKFTYNIGVDFLFLQLAVYLRGVHGATIETISAIASAGYLMQMLLISFVGWLAKVLVARRALGLSVSKWRKVFQGGSNLLMAACYLLLARLDPPLEVAACLVLAVGLFWMLGAGGESMVPYDLSTKFPASIVGFSHSVSIFSGIALTTLVGLVLGEHTDDSSKWSQLFLIISGLLAFGGLVFVVVLRAKPFLPGERQAAGPGREAGAQPKDASEHK